MKSGLCGIIVATVLGFAPIVRLEAQARGDSADQLELSASDVDEALNFESGVDTPNSEPPGFDQKKFNECMQGCEKGLCKFAEITHSSTANVLCIACYNGCSFQLPTIPIENL